MNTTASTSELSYTVLSAGDNERADFRGISLALLSRGGKPFRKEKIQKLFKLQLKEVLSIENSGCNLEDLTRANRNLKCIITHGEMSVGEKINIAVREASGSHILVMWDDMDLQVLGKTGRLFEKASEQTAVCSVPVLMDSEKQSIPIRLAPVFNGKKLEVVPLGSVKNETPALYPYDFCGIYNKEKFLLSEGFDPKISSPYWQKMDFGFRTFLWGERIQCYTGIKIAYQSEIPNEDTSVDESYARFFLKNLAFRYMDGTSRLSYWDILKYHLSSGMSIYTSLGHYKDCSAWIRKNQYRFRMDPYSLTELWEME